MAAKRTTEKSPKRSVSFARQLDQTLYIEQSSGEEAEVESLEDEEDESIHELETDEPVASGDGSAANSAWADAMSKLLNSSVTKKKDFILAKAKKDKDLVNKPKVVSSFEVVSEDGKSKLVTPQDESTDKKDKNVKSVNKKAELLKKVVRSADQCDPAKESKLLAIATKGVVQLFNAVNSQLSKIEKEVDNAGSRESNKSKARAAINEETFMETLEEMDDETEVRKDEPVAKKGKRSTKKLKGPSQPFAQVFSDDFAPSVLRDE